MNCKQSCLFSQNDEKILKDYKCIFNEAKKEMWFFVFNNSKTNQIVFDFHILEMLNKFHIFEVLSKFLKRVFSHEFDHNEYQIVN